MLLTIWWKEYLSDKLPVELNFIRAFLKITRDFEKIHTYSKPTKNHFHLEKVRIVGNLLNNCFFNLFAIIILDLMSCKINLFSTFYVRDFFFRLSWRREAIKMFSKNHICLDCSTTIKKGCSSRFCDVIPTTVTAPTCKCVTPTGG